MSSQGTIVGSVPPRVGHTAVADNDFMIIWGGYRDDARTFSERYLPTKTIMVYHTDLDVGFWTRHETEGDIPPGTSGASALLLDRKMYIIGGHTADGNTNDLFCLDLQQLKWTHINSDCGPKLSPRDKFAAWSYNKKLYCFGGFGVNVKTGNYLNENGKFVMDTSSQLPQEREWNNQLIIYDIESNTWSNPKCQGPVPSPRAAHAAVRLKNFVYVFGGRHGNTRMNDLHCLELDSCTWSGELFVEGPCPCGRSWHTFTAVSKDSIFLYGGYSTSCVPLDDAWLLNVRERQWSQLTLPNCGPRLWHTCCYTANGDLLVFGGCENDILKWDEPSIQSDKVLTFQLQPYRLQRLCLRTVYEHFSSDKWCILPKPLKDWLFKREQIDTLKSHNDDPDEKSVSVGATCALS